MKKFYIIVNIYFIIHSIPLYAANFEKVGDILQFAPVTLGYAISAYKDDTEGIKQLTRSTLVTVGLTQGVKATFNNTSWGRRPNGGNDSFVSGHTSFACSGAAFLTERYGYEYGLPALAIAATVGASRVDANKHHVRDVVAGCALSYVANEFFVTHIGEEELYPVIGPDMLGFRMKFDF